MNTIQPILKLTAVIGLIVALSACGKTNSGTSKDAASAFMAQSENVIAFGNADLKSVLTKSDYTNIPKLGKLLSSEFMTLEKVIDFSVPLYYAVEGPIDLAGNPAATYAFITLKDQDKFIAEMTGRGFDFYEKGDLHYSEDGDFAIGIKNKVAIVVVQNIDYEVESLMVSVFKKAESDVSEGTVNEILAEKGDLVIAMNVGSLYTTSNTDLEKLSEDKQESLKELVKDAYIQTVVKFENGAAIIETKNFFSDELKAKMFFNADQGAPVVAKLGKGKARAGFSMNIDMVKLQALVDEYSPGAVSDLARSMGGAAQFALVTTGTDMSKIFSGKLGVVMLGDLGGNGAMVPDFNVFVGLQAKGMTIGEMVKDMMSYSMQDVQLNNDGLFMSSNSANVSKNGGLALPNGCENFGKSGINAFINLEGVNFDDMDLEGEANVIRVIKYITFEYDNDGGRIYIKAKEGKENILKQAMDVLVEELAAEINTMAI